jgi:hypothetical protein
MNDDLIAQLMSNFISKEGQGPEDDYKDLLWQVLHAQNRGAERQDLDMMAGAIDRQRASDALDFGGGPSIESDPYIRGGRTTLNELLRNRR